MSLLFNLTSEQPFACQNNIFQHFNIFFCKKHTKTFKIHWKHWSTSVYVLLLNAGWGNDLMFLPGVHQNLWICVSISVSEQHLIAIIEGASYINNAGLPDGIALTLRFWLRPSCMFFIFSLFDEKDRNRWENAEIDNFNQHMACKAHICWSKYTTWDSYCSLISHQN